jgi:hypothetical protein
MTTARAAARLAATLLSAPALAACGGGGGEDAPPRFRTACGGPPIAGADRLPASFPKPSAVTYVKTEQRGPTRVVNGHFAGNLESAYDAYRQAFESAGYAITFDELEQQDAEVAYDDDASATSGLVALKDDCIEEELVSVRITSRPS